MTGRFDGKLETPGKTGRVGRFDIITFGVANCFARKLTKLCAD